ncbi:unnamed protein product [Blepharisma stoltei]|uniref:Anaphase-promoting complex subunit 4-like WD40 domain-containing protein n=1 Tax=Blepharisma stoltei TaxID=1481888 RepID=A0AAU9J082_9CILI|nr:unnamed protein product [Blepharisma stoltei]
MEPSVNFPVFQPINVNRKVYSKGFVGDGSTGIQCVRFDPLDRFLAAGCEDGTIRIFSMRNSKLVYMLNQQRRETQGNEEEKVTSTCIRWRPTTSSSKTKNVLISVHADGSVQHWHVTSGKSLHRLYSANNPLYCADFAPDGTKFATAGRDLIVRVYDETTKQAVVEFQPGGSGSPGHSNRIFSVKFYSQDPNILISGGWDNTIQVWDIREGCAVRAIFGPHVCGDTLDIKDGVILAGSWREREQLQNFYLGSGECICTIDWDGGVGIRRSAEPCKLYSAQYSKHDEGEMILAGGSNEARFFDTMNYNKPFAAVMDLPNSVFSTDFSYSGDMAAIGCSDGYARLVTITKTV